MDKQELLAIINSDVIRRALTDAESRIRRTALRDKQFKKAAQKQLDRGGKRLRPLILLTATPSNRKITVSHIKCAAAIELVHQASLFHDHIIDEEEAETSIFILAGDYLLAEALNLASQVNAAVSRILAGCIADMASGQALQLGGAYKADTANKVYLETVKLKTGSLFTACCEIASLLNVASQAESTKLKKFGSAFGTGFQIIDDCNDGEFSHDKLQSAQVAASEYIKRSQNALARLNDETVRNRLSNLAATYLVAAMPETA